jgi:hypothetical protein
MEVIFGVVTPKSFFQTVPATADSFVYPLSVAIVTTVSEVLPVI